MSRKDRVPGMAATKSYAIPRCSECETQMTRDDAGQWVCIPCFDKWLNEVHFEGKSIGGVQLPSGVRDERRRSIKDVWINRRFRRG